MEFQRADGLLQNLIRPFREVALESQMVSRRSGSQVKKGEVGLVLEDATLKSFTVCLNL